VGPSETEEAKAVIGIIGVRVIIIGIIGNVVFRRSRIIVRIGYKDGWRVLTITCGRWRSGRRGWNQLCIGDILFACARVGRQIGEEISAVFLRTTPHLGAYEIRKEQQHHEESDGE
jgi:hypothetical protein